VNANEIWPRTPEDSSNSPGSVDLGEPQDAAPKVDLGPFCKFPSKFFGSGLAARLGTSAALLYLALCENCNRCSRMTFEASDKALASETGLAERTIRNGRNRLVENGLIQCSREGLGRRFTYLLLRQELKWVRRQDRPRRKRKPRAMSASGVSKRPLMGPADFAGGAANFAAVIGAADFARGTGKVC